MSNFERGSLKQRAIAVAVASCYLTSAQANPTGASVAAGNVVFDVNGKMLTITNTPGAIINWQQFSIQKDEITRFIQQNASSAVLNRVGGANNPSYILGTLRSELTSGAIGGRVFLINPSGITFGAGSVVNVGGLVASTLGMSDADFATAAAGGRMRFIGAGGESELRNAGEIRTAEGGHVYLVAPKVVNEGPAASNPAGGVIASPKGEIIVAAGTSVELVNAGTPDIRVELTAPANEVVNAGKIVAASGRVGIYGTLIRNSGLVSASAAALGEGGKIVFKALKDVTLDASSRLEANGAKGGDVTIQAETGTLLARGTIEAKGAVEKGGRIHLLGAQVGLVDGAQVDASGQSGGGTVLVGGDQRGANPDVQNADAVYLGADTSVRADALESGDGGKVVVYSKDATRAYGSISARGSASGAGGSVETSGRYLEIAQGPDVTGGLGGGTWLIDPYNIDIVAGNGTSNNTGTPDFTPSGDNSQIGADLISAQLSAGTSVTVDTGGAGSPGTQAGNITVSAGISATPAPTATLGLHAFNDVAINAGINLLSGNVDIAAGRNVSVTQSVLAGGLNVNAGADVNVTSSLSSGGAMTLNAGGALNVAAGGTQNAVVSGNASQTINAKSLSVTAQDGLFASIQGGVGGQQITISGGGTSAGVDVRSLSAGSSASISNNAGNQTILVTNADHINVSAAAGGIAALSVPNGTQTISITGSGANAFTIGAAGSLGAAQVVGRGQSITAGLAGQSGAISITGPAATPTPAATTGIITASPGPAVLDAQSISTSGALTVTGGTAASGQSSGIFHNRQGQQTITAASIAIRGGASGSNNGASISSQSTGDQVVNVAGDISITGGTVGNGNRASISAGGNQTITGNGNIAVTGGASGGAANNGNFAFINGGVGKLQTINAGSISVSSGIGGIDNSATILGAKQVITTTGNFTVSGSGSSGPNNGSRVGGLNSATAGATDLTLNVGGDVILTAGANANGAGSLASNNVTPPFATNIKVNAAGSVILNAGAGSGSRIGSSNGNVGGGDISVTAGNSIQFNGNATQTAAIRTTGNVSLTAGTISETANGLIIANNLTVKTSGNADLTGQQNRVSSLSAPTTGLPPTLGVGGNLSFNNTGALSVGSTTVGGALNLTTTSGDLNVTSIVTSGGAMNVNAAGALNVNGAGLQDAMLRSSGGQTITAQSVNLTAQNNRRANIENQVSGSQTITATAGGMNLQALGGSGVAQIANSALGGSQTVSMSGQLNVLGGTTGVPNGSRNSGIFQTVNALQKVTSSGITLQASGTGTSNATASGALINSSGSQVVDAGAGAISLTGGAAGSNNSAAISNSNGPQTVSAGSISLQAGAGGTANNASISSTNGGQTVTATNVSLQGGAGSSNVASVRALGTTGDQVLNVTGGSLTVAGGTIGNGNQAAVTSVGNQTINGNPNITVTGGASGGVANSANNAIISATNAGKQQTINAGSISVSSGAGGIDNSGTITGATQTITATGNVTVSGGATTGTSNGSRIGGLGGGNATDTNLTLTAGGDVILTGGSADGSGARLGSSATTSALTNNVTVNAGGSVILNGGTAQGAAIGYSTQDSTTPPAGGTISVTAGNAIQLNGGPTNTSIRTLGDVTLNAGTISAGTNGFILANNLTLKTAGDATLTGPNQVASLSAPPSDGPTTIPGVGGHLSFKNAGALSVGNTAVGGALSLTTTAGDLDVTSLVTSNGATFVNAAGALNVNGAGLQDAILRSRGGQTITAQSVNLTAQNNRLSNIENRGSGSSQTITATAGGINLQALGGSGVAQIANNALNGSQTVSMSGQLNVLGGTTGVPNGSRNSGIFQTVNALQKVTASGITLQASGTGTSNATASGALISSSGSQTIDVGGGSISLVGGAGGANNSAAISSSGDQIITAGGSISLTGGTVGNNNRANISSGGNQTINGNPDITVTGGASGGVANSANSATISAGAGKVQTINAGSISVTAGAGGIDNSGTITGATQSITATGNVTVTGGATTGTSNGSRIGGLGGSSPSNTNLTLNVGGDLILTGGSADGSGARLGSSATTSPLTNNVTVNAGGSVILNGGTAQGAAIGYSTQDPTTPPAGGTISVSAGNSIQLNGGPTNTSIRTLGDVTLTAGTTISEGTNGFILANRLTTSSGGDTTLIGPNRVSSFSGSSATGSVTLNNIGALAVNSVVAANNAALTNLGAMSVNGPMSAGGTLSVTADSVNGAGNIATGGGFTVNVAGESLLSGVISGAGGLNKLGAGTLTVSGDNTYAGETDVLAGTLALGGSDRTNSGVVNIFSGATYRGSAGTFNNAGVIEGDGTLDVSATTFTNSGTLRPGGSGAIGTLTVSGNAIFGPSSLIDIEAQGAGNGNHDVLAITGAASLGGNLNVTHINGYAPLTDDAITPVTYASRTGTLGINPDSWLPTYNPAGLTLVFDPNVNRWIGTSGNWNVAANWSRGHTPLAFETALIDVAGNQLVTVSDGARAAGKLRSSEDFLISGGSLSLGGPSFFYGALSLTGGTLQGAGSITVNGAFNWSGGSLGGSGQFITAPGAMSTLAPSAQNLLLGRTWLNQGHVTWQSSNGRDLVIAEGASLVNTLGGEFTLAAAHGGNIKGDGVFRNEGTVTMNGADKTAIKTSFTNSATGVLNVNSGALKLKRSASNEGSVRIAAGATLELKQDYINYGRLSGNGILDASGIRFTNLGVLAPGGNDGLGIGTFTIRGDYHQGSTGVLDMGLGGVAAGQYDVLAVSGKAFLDGTLQTSAVNGYVPVASDSFKLITYKSRSGAFSALTAPAGLTLDADYTKRFGIFELE